MLPSTEGRRRRYRSGNELDGQHNHLRKSAGGDCFQSEFDPATCLVATRRTFQSTARKPSKRDVVRLVGHLQAWLHDYLKRLLHFLTVAAYLAGGHLYADVCGNASPGTLLPTLHLPQRLKPRALGARPPLQILNAPVFSDGWVNEWKPGRIKVGAIDAAALGPFLK